MIVIQLLIGSTICNYYLLMQQSLCVAAFHNVTQQPNTVTALFLEYVLISKWLRHCNLNTDTAEYEATHTLAFPGALLLGYMAQLFQGKTLFLKKKKKKKWRPARYETESAGMPGHSWGNSTWEAKAGGFILNWMLSQATQFNTNLSSVDKLYLGVARRLRWWRPEFSPWDPQSNRSTDSHKPFSDFHMYAMQCV